MNNAERFIETIGNLAKNEYVSRGPQKAILPSVCIAQAALESGWNLNAKSLFGIKGKGFVATTSEYYNGVKQIIQDSFRAYPDVASAVVGYYDFIASTPRYAHCLGNADYKQVVYNLQHTLDGRAYATDPKYEEKICSIIEMHNLTRWDSIEQVPVAETPTTNNVRTYKIKPGDTLSQIAKMFGVPMSQLVELNHIQNPNMIRAGATITIDRMTTPTYVVKAGDNLTKIAIAHNTTVEHLVQINHIQNPDLIHVGQVLVL